MTSKTTITPKKPPATPQQKKVGQSPGSRTPLSLQKPAIKRPSAVNDAKPFSFEASRGVASSPLASKRPKTCLASPQSKAKTPLMSPKQKTPIKTVTFSPALTETYEVERRSGPTHKTTGSRSSTPSPSRSSIKKNVASTKAAQTPAETTATKPTTNYTNDDLAKMIQEQNSRIEKLAKELEKEKAARLTLEKRLKLT